MIYAATHFEQGVGDAYAVFMDSAFIHARNLFEFIRKKSSKGGFTLDTIGGVSADKKAWRRFLNNRACHMYEREKDRPKWPDGLDNDRKDKLTVMSRTIVDLLESNGQTISQEDIKNAYYRLIKVAKDYLTVPTEENFNALSRLYDDSRDYRDY